MRFLTLAFTLLFLCPASHAARADEPAPALPREVSINGVEFVLIPQGWFWYSVAAGHLGLLPANAPLFRHVRVWLDSYYLAKYEARARDFARFLNSGPEPSALLAAQEKDTLANYAEHDTPPDLACTLRRDSAGVYQLIDGQHEMPATNLSWTVADAFAGWMGFRLPSEAEWEKAARGPDPERRHWPWGNDYADDTYAHFNAGSHCHPAPVTAYPKGRSPYGLYNMAGNVEEHVADWYNTSFDASLKDGARNPLPAATATPLPGEKPKKIKKGGRWSLDVAQLTIAERDFEAINLASIRVGARFAVDVSTVRRHLAHGTATILDSQ